MYYSQSKILSKFVEKLRKYRIMFKNILTFKELDYRDAPLKIFYFIILGIYVPKIR